MVEQRFIFELVNKQLHILYTVLDWGLGHATRSIPVISYLLEKGVKLSIAGEGNSLFILQKQFPDCKVYPLKGIKISYSENIPLSLKMALSVPANLRSIYSEHQQMNSLVEELKPDAIISDNRFGAWSKKIPSVFISHQIKIKAPQNLKWLEPAIYSLNKFFIKHFTKVWIPDFRGDNNLTGELTHDETILKNNRYRFIGPLSRFKKIISDTHERYELLIILSGPEPQRSIFEKLCIQQSLKLNLKTIIICGKPKDSFTEIQQNLTLISDASNEHLQMLIQQSEYIVSRSGHSTIMDLLFLERSALCIPTPGQTEQEYIADYLAGKKFIITQKQSNFNLEKGILQIASCIPMPNGDLQLIKQEVERFLSELSQAK